MKTCAKSLILGIALAGGAFLLMGQARVTQSAPQVGRYQVVAASTTSGVYVCDTATGAVKFIFANPKAFPQTFGVPFEDIK